VPGGTVMNDQAVPGGAESEGAGPPRPARPGWVRRGGQPDVALGETQACRKLVERTGHEETRARRKKKEGRRPCGD